ncbi:hypothetical protein BCV69DRAFT_291596 [Microstroma glucosiphilum]|uniref:Uncharacterized protein n=1 Tax=Pseudomicrostroma glucosiphilum TaxID=1684307 RepID=A0A316UJW9_9BASI|nr:hypothetical protein BCV69DRAFT_291596 [Pseudomicrostroma glucosiphilum]PWN23515.1 hypothetical protein BCV69DRAFT_291596 [Pseudomicrostroma glucosiphilum]
MSQLTIGPAAPTEQTEQTVTPAVASTAAFMRERRVRNWAYEVSLRPPLENLSGGNDLFLAPYETFPPEIPHAQYGQRDDNGLGTDDDGNRGRLPVDRDTARLRELHGDASELLDEINVPCRKGSNQDHGAHRKVHHHDRKPYGKNNIRKFWRDYRTAYRYHYHHLCSSPDRFCSHHRSPSSHFCKAGSQDNFYSHRRKAYRKAHCKAHRHKLHRQAIIYNCKVYRHKVHCKDIIHNSMAHRYHCKGKTHFRKVHRKAIIHNSKAHRHKVHRKDIIHNSKAYRHKVYRKSIIHNSKAHRYYCKAKTQFCKTLPLPERQALDPEDVLYSIFNSGDASNVHRVFTEFIERKLNPGAGSIARHFRFQPGDARNLAIIHLGIADEPQTSDEAYQEPEGWCYNPREGTGFIESTRNVTAVIPLMALDRNEEFVVVSDCGDGAKEPDVLILDEHRPWVILMAIEIVYKNESIVGILYSLSIWTQQTTQRRAHVPPSAEPGGARPPCHALVLHVADAHEFRQDPCYPAFAWAEAYRYEPGKEPVAGGFHGNLVVMNASSAYCQLWKDALASELCPIRLLFVGNSHVFHLPIPVRAPTMDGEEVTYTQPQWDLASLTFMYHEGMLLDSFENDGGLNPTPRRGEARLEA